MYKRKWFLSKNVYKWHCQKQNKETFMEKIYVIFKIINVEKKEIPHLQLVVVIILSIKR